MQSDAKQCQREGCSESHGFNIHWDTTTWNAVAGIPPGYSLVVIGTGIQPETCTPNLDTGMQSSFIDNNYGGTWETLGDRQLWLSEHYSICSLASSTHHQTLSREISRMQKRVSFDQKLNDQKVQHQKKKICMISLTWCIAKDNWQYSREIRGTKQKFTLDQLRPNSMMKITTWIEAEKTDQSNLQIQQVFQNGKVVVWQERAPGRQSLGFVHHRNFECARLKYGLQVTWRGDINV